MIEDTGLHYVVDVDTDILKILECFRVYCDHQYGDAPRRWKLGDKLSFPYEQKLRSYSAYLGGHNLWDCGEYSYSHSVMPLGFSCGRYCSISWNVKVSGWQHPIDAVTTSLVSCNPAVRFVRQALCDQNISELKLAPTPQKSPPKVGNDVWIGMDVTLMAGIEVGDGAIIAAGSIVTKNVEPYAIVGGNPARLIRWRFDEETRIRLRRLSWWRFNINAFSDLDLGDVQSFLNVMEDREPSLERWSPPNPFFVEEIEKALLIDKSEDELSEEFITYLHQQKFGEAESVCIRWGKSFDESWRPHDALGHLYSRKGEHDSALKHAQKAISISGRTWGHVARLGLIHEKLGDLAKAEELLSEAAALPDGHQVASDLQRVNLYNSRRG